MLFFRQLDWKEFSNQPHIKKLPLNEQMQQFNFHLQQMSNLNYYQPKGQSSSTITPTVTPTPTPTPSPTVTPTPSPTPTPTVTPTPSPTPTPTPNSFTPSGDEYTLSNVFSYGTEAIDLTNSTPQEVADYWCANGTLGTSPNGGPDTITLQKAVGNTDTVIEIGDRIISPFDGNPISPGTQLAPDNGFLILNNATQAFTTVSDGIVTAVATFTC